MIPLYDDNPTKNKSYIRLIILIICLFVFFIQQTANNNDQLIFFYGFKPASFFYDYNAPTFSPILTIFTSMFMHGGWMHFLSNMLYLWIFADNIEDRMGKKKFIFFYLTCGAFAAISQALADIASPTPMIGASGAIAGILGSYLHIYPKAKVLVLVPFIIFFTVRIPAYILLIFWFFLQFYNLSLGSDEISSIAWIAHIGGFIFGYTYSVLTIRKKKWIKGKSIFFKNNNNP